MKAWTRVAEQALDTALDERCALLAEDAASVDQEVIETSAENPVTVVELDPSAPRRGHRDAGALAVTGRYSDVRSVE